MKNLPELLDEPDSIISEDYLMSIMGNRYKGNGIVLCGYCLQEELEFIDIYQDYKCQLCKEAEQ